jgi:hypothetical protein
MGTNPFTDPAVVAGYVAEQGQVVMTVTSSNACPAPSRPTESIAHEIIGRVANEFDEDV